MGRQHDFLVDDFALVGIVFLFLVVLGKEPFPALVGSGSDCGLTVAALDDFYIMVWTWQARFLLSPRCWGKKRAGNLSKDFLLGGAASGRRVFSFESSGQVGPMWNG